MEAVGDMEPRVERRIIVRGQVQGVGYRWFARETAGTLGVAGWARNMPDGSVLLEVAASASTLDRFEAELRVGRRSARVTEVIVVKRTDDAPLPDPFVIVG